MYKLSNDDQRYFKNILYTRIKDLSVVVRDKPFKLSSGRESRVYVDCKQTILAHDGHFLCGLSMYYALLDAEKDLALPPHAAVAGVELGGCFLASAVSFYACRVDPSRRLPALAVRKEAKEHGTSSLVEGMRNVPTSHVTGKEKPSVVLLDDVITSGGSAVRAVDTLRRVGYNVDLVISLIDREEGGEKALDAVGVSLVSLYTLKEFNLGARDVQR